MLKMMCRLLIMTGMVATASLVMAADTNVISFAYTTSVAADASTPDAWLRKLNDGYWTNGVADALQYGGDVTVTADLGRRMQLTQVDLFTYSKTGAETLATSAVTLECSQDNITWISLGSMATDGDGHFSGSNFWANARYLRVSCTQVDGADGQLIAELVISSSSDNPHVLLPFTYTTWIPAMITDHPDNLLQLLKDGRWSASNTQSVQYGVRDVADVDPEEPRLSVASNLVVSVTLEELKILRSAHLYAYNLAGNTYGTQRVTLSNSVDGINWSCLGEQTLYTSLEDEFSASGEVSRFDFILPNVESRYLDFACEKKDGVKITRQLLAEIEVQGSTFSPALGDPLMYTYEFNKTVSGSADRAECPRLTDQAWNHVVNNALRFYDDVEITADLGAPMYIAGTDLVCWANKFNGIESYYGTGRVVVNGSLDKINWSELADFTDTLPGNSPFHHAFTFKELPYVRYLRLDAYRYDGSALGRSVDAQIIGELFIYRPPSAILGAAPVAVANAIPFAGFESDPLLPVGGLVQGGSTNGWIFSFSDQYNCSGYQRNNSVLSTNISGSTSTRYYAPEGVQSAMLMGYGTMECEMNVPQDGDYQLQFQLNASYLNTTDRGGHDFRITLDGSEITIIQVQQLIFVKREIVLRNLKAGAHTLRFEGIGSINMNCGSLIDDLQLLWYDLPADQVKTQGAEFTLIANSAVPLDLSYSGSIRVGDLWVGGVHLPPGKYAADVNSTVFQGAGLIGFDRGSLIIVR